MEIIVNGSSENLNKSCSIYDYITNKGLTPEKIVIEHNYNIIPMDKYKTTILNDNDKIEVLNFVGGG
ncbi:MAG: sulfur carrier protein ThiS [Desulfobacterales bacterium]|nr:sulfur carrier protein ThiS [Desulfobacterales bacterium]